MKIMDIVFTADNGCTFCYYYSEKTGSTYVDIRNKDKELIGRTCGVNYKKAKKLLDEFYKKHGKLDVTQARQQPPSQRRGSTKCRRQPNINTKSAQAHPGAFCFGFSIMLG